MASDKQFSHITVNAAEEDDVVIQAGSPLPPVDEPAPPSALPVSQDDVEVAPEAATAAAAAEPEAFEVSTEQVFESPEPQGLGASDAPADTPAAPAWREQTLEDLETGPMSNMQKIVLGAAAVFVIVALVWYFCFMR